jgi:hypothetical protein
MIVELHTIIFRLGSIIFQFGSNDGRRPKPLPAPFRGGANETFQFKLDNLEAADNSWRRPQGRLCQPPGPERFPYVWLPALLRTRPFGVLCLLTNEAFVLLCWPN